MGIDDSRVGNARKAAVSVSQHGAADTHGQSPWVSTAKVFIVGTFHGLGDRHIQQYLNEFCYRFNRRHRENELFDRLLRACATAPQITHDELTA
jgi:hypothetical protein